MASGGVCCFMPILARNAWRFFSLAVRRLAGALAAGLAAAARVTALGGAGASERTGVCAGNDFGAAMICVPGVGAICVTMGVLLIGTCAAKLDV